MSSSGLRDIEEQLKELEKLKISSSSKKVGPAVPPKPKKIPVIPQSYVLDNPGVPSYSSPLHNYSNDVKPVQLYSNLPPPPPPTETDNIVEDPSYYNLPPPPPPIAANEVIYGNIPCSKTSAVYANDSASVSDLPPPSPPSYENVNALNEFPPPPSPVSSSYSELRRATHQTPSHSQSTYGTDYAVYGPNSTSSTYESIYEPICPRPPSQMSSYSLYAPYVSGSETARQEKQVNALTDLLVQSLDAPAEEDILGVCDKCQEYVINEGSGCTAMDKVYHIACFTCHVCKTQLQGEPFFALEGKPYCEKDYLNTLEKCSVCMKPILDRILRATGKPYHPQCFTCVVCGRSLDGVPFTVDAVNQIHCITDFHKKFAPRCCVCKLPIMPEPGKEETVRVVALDRSFHVTCYKCEDCGLVLSSEVHGRGCYPLDDHVLCKNCNANRIQRLTTNCTTDL